MPVLQANIRRSGSLARTCRRTSSVPTLNANAALCWPKSDTSVTAQLATPTFDRWNNRCARREFASPRSRCSRRGIVRPRKTVGPGDRSTQTRGRTPVFTAVGVRHVGVPFENLVLLLRKDIECRNSSLRPPAPKLTGLSAGPWMNQPTKGSPVRLLSHAIFRKSARRPGDRRSAQTPL